MIKTILVVDDEGSIATTLRMILEDEGYRVHVAYNGLDALQLMAEEQPSLVITDLMMPLLGGLGLAQCIHDDPKLRDIPVVLMSAMREPKKGGPVYRRFLPKPFDLGVVVDLVAELTVA